MKKLIEDLAEVTGIPANHFRISFGLTEGEWGYEIGTVSVGKVRAKNYRPIFYGYGATPEEAVKDYLSSQAYRRWKDPEALEREQSLNNQLEMFKSWRNDGTLTQEQYDHLIKNFKAKHSV